MLRRECCRGTGRVGRKVDRSHVCVLTQVGEGLGRATLDDPGFARLWWFRKAPSRHVWRADEATADLAESTAAHIVPSIRLETFMSSPSYLEAYYRLQQRRDEGRWSRCYKLCIRQ